MSDEFDDRTDGFSEEGGDGPIGLTMPRKTWTSSGDLDITPMIDIVFLLLIFFLVTSIPDAQSAVDLPEARHGDGVGTKSSTVFTLADPKSQAAAKVYAGPNKSGTPLPEDLKLQDELIAAAVEQGVADGKVDVIIKAEKGVKHREVARVAAAAARVDGISIHLAVHESP